MGFAISSGRGWSSAYLVIGLIQVALMLALLVSIPLRGKVDRSRPAAADEAADEPQAGHVPLMTALRIPGVLLIRGGFALIGAGSLLLLLPLPTDVVGLVGLLLAGIGCAPIYPAIIHSTPASFGRQNSQAIIGIQMAAAYTGSTIAPPLFGALSAVTGLWILPLFLLPLVVLGLVMSERLNRLVDAR